jgi:hypothetical protein
MARHPDDNYFLALQVIGILQMVIEQASSPNTLARQVIEIAACRLGVQVLLLPADGLAVSSSQLDAVGAVLTDLAAIILNDEAQAELAHLVLMEIRDGLENHIYDYEALKWVPTAL